MDEATPEMIEMARRICAKLDPNKAYQFLDGSRDDYPAMQAALAAIIETQRLDVEEADAYSRGPHAQKVHGANIAALIRAGHHYGRAA